MTAARIKRASNFTLQRTMGSRCSPWPLSAAFGTQTKGGARGRHRPSTSSTGAGDRKHVRFALRGPTGSKRLRSTKCLPALALALLFSSLASLLAVDAQSGKLYRIGMLERTSTAINAANLDGLRRGLRELGYVEGKNFVIEYRSADGRDERFPGLATELIRLNVDLILTRGTPAALAAKSATQTIPVVMAASGDPVGTGLVASLGRPGGNVTGLSNFNVEIYAKRVELLRELLPQLTRSSPSFSTCDGPRTCREPSIRQRSSVSRRSSSHSMASRRRICD